MDWDYIGGCASRPVMVVCFCGKPLTNHARCAGCGILAGPGHIVTCLYDGYCQDCRPDKPAPVVSDEELMDLWGLLGDGVGGHSCWLGRR